VRGYFGIGVEGVTKPYNVGSVFRSAHAFGAAFVFTVAANYERRKGARIDTSDAVAQVPFYDFPTLNEMVLPGGCALVGVELDDTAVELPSFRHPTRAAYILGKERGSLSASMFARCDHLIRIPTQFSLNLGMAGVIVMYDRLISLGRFPNRPVSPGGPVEDLPPHVHGGPVLRQDDTVPEMQAYRSDPPLEEVALAARKGSED
jgi:tRNA(Leu) C34 or U34 (ribose-2'-O)-methylase TrmL